mmetsp:Transcript_31702/g.37794  ORF Transcript_31702/g.37794 Transcript_31702/m.37794 type:complete len:101 (+) Transcript_31702:143-445(+)
MGEPRRSVRANRSSSPTSVSTIIWWWWDWGFGWMVSGDGVCLVRRREGGERRVGCDVVVIVVVWVRNNRGRMMFLQCRRNMGGSMPQMKMVEKYCSRIIS